MAVTGTAFGDAMAFARPPLAPAALLVRHVLHRTGHCDIKVAPSIK